ncbi:MAG: CHAT domain-containing protein, partial [Pseudomonadota bacterium]
DADLGDRFPQFAKLGTPRPLTVADAQAGLAQDAVLIQFTRRANALYVFAVTRDTYVWRKLPTTVRETVENVAAMRCGLDSAEWVGDVRPLRCLDLIGAMPDDGGVLPFPRERAHKLYMTLISPLADVIGNKRLIVVPDHILAKLPLQTLLAKPAGADVPLAKLTWLAKSHAVSVLPSVASLTTLTAAAKLRTTSRPYLAVANPLLTGATGDDFSAFKRQDCKPAKPPETETNLTVAALPGVKNAGGLVVRGGAVDAQSVRRLTPLADTADEVCDVARIFNTAADDVLLGSAATEARITAANDAGRLAEARILHFATHGLVTGEVRGLTEPALVLTPPAEAKPGDDGLLTASEVARLNLDADWVVLSACNTAAGDAPGAEALSGLARAFLYAGTRSLLVSHWPVQSAAAVRLVTDTVGRLTKEQGLTRDEALRRAMAKLIDDDANALNAHPQIWAPFALVGSTAPLVTAAVKPVPQSAITATPLRKTVKPARTRAPRRRARRAVQRPKPPAVQPQDDWRTRVFSR